MQKTSSINQSFIVMGLVYLMLFSPVLLAKMYKWIDADGNTHYTQSPPPDGIESETIKVPGKVDAESAQKSLEEKKKKVDSYQKQRNEKAEELAKEEEEKKLNSKNCEIARSNASTLERPRVNLKDSEGNFYSASEEERVRRLNQAKEDVKKYCN
jgi:uncharacterized protein DUF4124